MNIYQDIILDHYHTPHNFGDLDNADKQITVNNPLCGDIITMKVSEEKGFIKEIRFSGEGCAISVASASLLTDYVKGKTIDELRRLNPDFIIKLLGIELSPSRLKCALLPLEAVTKLVTNG